MPSVEDFRYEREEALEAVQRCQNRLDTMCGEDSTASKLSIERKLQELERKWLAFKAKSSALLDKQKVKSTTDPLHAPEKQIVDDAYDAMDDIVNKAYDKIQSMEQAEGAAAVANDAEKFKSLTQDSKKRVNTRIEEIRTGIGEVTGVAELGRLNMYVGWLNAAEKILVHETLPAFDSWKGSVPATEKLNSTGSKWGKPD